MPEAQARAAKCGLWVDDGAMSLRMEDDCTTFPGAIAVDVIAAGEMQRIRQGPRSPCCLYFID
jgi:hypothetical protein